MSAETEFCQKRKKKPINIGLSYLYKGNDIKSWIWIDWVLGSSYALAKWENGADMSCWNQLNIDVTYIFINTVLIPHTHTNDPHTSAMHLLTLLAVYSTKYTAYQSSVSSLLSYPLLLLVQELELELDSIVTI